MLSSRNKLIVLFISAVGCGGSPTSSTDPNAPVSDAAVLGDADVDPSEGPLRAFTPRGSLKRIGTAVDQDRFDAEPAYRETLAREFNAIVFENALKWERVHPEPNVWNFEHPDRLIAFAEEHGQWVKGHVLLWHLMYPPYLDDLEPDELRQAVVDHITTLVSRYRGRIHAWDVANEVIENNGDGYRASVFLDKLGPDFIELAFRTAHAADPDALLFLNDYGGEGIGPKSDAVYELAKRLVDADVPIHGVGLQMHIRLDYRLPPIVPIPDGMNTPEYIRENIERLSALGLLVEVSEMDVPIGYGDPEALGERLEQQGRVYHDVVSTCVGTPRCEGTFFWGFLDEESWLNEIFRNNQHALLFGENYTKKPSYYGVLKALTSAAD